MRHLVIILGICCIISLPVSAQAERSLFPILTGSALGATVGACVGATAMIFSSDPGKNMHWVGYGAGIGLACGFTLGLITVIPAITSTESSGGRGDRTYGFLVFYPFGGPSTSRERSDLWFERLD